MDGKVLIWAWFQQFSEELPLHEVSPVTVRKAFDELVTKLDKLAVKRSTAMKQVPVRFAQLRFNSFHWFIEFY